MGGEGEGGKEGQRHLPSLRSACVLPYSVVVSTLTRYVRGLGSDPSRDTKVHLCYATGVVAAVWEVGSAGW